MSEAINFYGIEADKVNARSADTFGHGWTRSDLPWRPVWFRSEFVTFAEREARKRAHVIAFSLGTLTAFIWATAVAHILFTN